MTFIYISLICTEFYIRFLMYGSKGAVLPQGGQALVIVGGNQCLTAVLLFLWRLCFLLRFRFSFFLLLALCVCTFLDWMYVFCNASYAININCVFSLSLFEFLSMHLVVCVWLQICRFISILYNFQIHWYPSVAYNM